MEGLGAAASVIAVLQITTQVASLAYVYGYTTGVKRAPTNLQGLIDELKSLVKILSSLQSTAQHSSSAVLGQLFTPLLNYSMEMKSLNDKLEAKQKKLQSSWWGASFTSFLRIIEDTTRETNVTMKARRKPNTGHWILKSPKVQEWRRGSGLLWGYGIHGAGKTFLSSLLIDSLRAEAKRKGYSVAHIYFNYKEQ
ncbi:uncharacterized protein LAJ45_10732 [Morchella importuna]|uniref:uncharacterized protein n=1 Tax=Morchella importuna TaxID=1174673 RepID=UPI001E8DE2CE|nr:uncharacterized protein LAJ45_10732 [Morchella importuna]KAH8145295.1 hypothetical protein LAJ45_10732 [Morchella importuna]